MELQTGRYKQIKSRPNLIYFCASTPRKKNNYIICTYACRDAPRSVLKGAAQPDTIYFSPRLISRPNAEKQNIVQ